MDEEILKTNEEVSPVSEIGQAVKAEVDAKKAQEEPHLVEQLFRVGELIPMKGLWFQVVEVNHDGWLALGAKQLTKKAAKTVAARLAAPKVFGKADAVNALNTTKPGA